MRAKGSPVLLVAAALAAAIALPACGGDWLAFRNGPERHNATTDSFASPLSLVWRYTSAPSSQRVPPVIAADRVYCATASRMYCLDLATGAPVWGYDAGKEILGAPTYADGRLVFGAQNGKLVCLNAADGKEAWVVALAGSVRAAPAVVGGMIYAASLDRRVVCVDAATGQQRWVTHLTDELWGAPAVVGNVVIVPTADAQVFGLDADDGRVRMQVTLPRRRALLHPVVVTDDAMYVTGRADLTALSRRGSQRWTIEFTAFLTGAPAFADGRLYASLIDGRVFAVDPVKGRTLWEFDFNTAMSSPPTVAGDVVIAGAVGGLVYAIDAATGKPRWRYEGRPPGLAIGSKSSFDLVASPVYSNESLYLIWDDGNLARFDAQWPDVVPPTIRALTPQENMVAGTNLPKVIGAQVYDEESGLDSASLAMTLDEAPVPAEYDPYTGNYTYTIAEKSPFAPFKQGWHTVSITARDQRGNQVSRTWRFVAQPGAEKAVETAPAVFPSGPPGIEEPYEPGYGPPEEPSPPPGQPPTEPGVISPGSPPAPGGGGQLPL